MSKFFTNTYSVINIYREMSAKSEVVTQMLYGDSFSVIQKSQNWQKIKIKEDQYQGYIKNKEFNSYVKPTHKIYKLKAKVYRFPNKKRKILMLPFGSKLTIKERKGKFIKFEKGCIHQKDIKLLDFREENIFKKIKLFKNTKYKWGGKSFKGIDCSGLVQLFLNFNNKPCPRDAKDQIRFFNRNVKLKNIKKNDIIYWEGHVAIVLSKTKLIHAYGPMKKTVIMDINKTLELIKNTAKLDFISIKRV